MATTFYKPKNNGGSTVSVAYVAGSGNLYVSDSTSFGTPTTNAPIRMTCVRKSDSAMVILGATGKTGNKFTGVTVLEGTTDINLAVGDTVLMLVTAGAIDDLNTAVNTLEGWHPPTFTDSGAPNNTVFYSSTSSKLSYKDAGGTVTALY